MSNLHHNLSAQDPRWSSHGSVDGPAVPSSWTTAADGWGVLCDSPTYWDTDTTEPSGLVSGTWNAPAVEMAGPAGGHFLAPMLLVVILLSLLTALHLELNTSGGPVAVALAAAGDNLAATHGTAPPAESVPTTVPAPSDTTPAPAPEPAPAPAPAPGETPRPDSGTIIAPPAPSAPSASSGAPAASDPGPAAVAPSHRAPAPATPAPTPTHPPLPPVQRGGVAGDSSWDN